MVSNNIPPILFVVFNRPKVTQIVFEAIRNARPKKLYIASDGPRKDRFEEAELVYEVRSIVEKIDWDCNVKTMYRTNNLGCKMAVSGAIDWFFEHEDKGIILEDDCNPHPFFFDYCRYYLDVFGDNKKIFSISGTRFSYFEKNRTGLGKYSLMWGWATWKDRWKKYGVDINKDEIESVVNDSFTKNYLRNYWKEIFSKTACNQINTWDYQWMFAIFKNGGLVVRPAFNLVNNLGFGQDATHTKNENSECEMLTRLAKPFDLVEEVVSDECINIEDENIWLNLNSKRKFEYSNQLLQTLCNSARALRAKLRQV